MMPARRPAIMTVGTASSPSELRIKGSRFIGQVFHVESKQEFESIYHQFQKEYTRASHYCYAYRLSANLYHYYDDGEPNGTAGKPIYHVLDEHNLFEALLIVVRYFGGVKLGRNGLVRAYTRSALESLQQGTIIPKIFYQGFRFQLPYVLVQDLIYLVKKYDGIIDQTDYQDQIKMQARIAQEKSGDFITEINILSTREPLIFELAEVK